MDTCEDRVSALIRERELADSLFNISTIITSSVDFEETMRMVLMESAKAIGSEASGIALREDDHWVMRYMYNLPPELTGKVFSDEELPGAAVAMKTNKSSAFLEGLHEQMMKEFGIRPALITPLIVRDRMIGCLFFNDLSVEITLDDRERAFAEKAAALVSLAIENAGLVQERERLIEEMEKERGRFDAVEEALRESESKFRNIASAAQDAVILIDNDGTVMFWNDAATKIFGYSSEEMTGKHLHSFIMPRRYLEEHIRGFEAFRMTGQGRFIGKTYEIEAMRKDGTEFPVELSLAALKLKGKWNSIGIVRDITARKRAEEELKRTVEELESSNKELQQFAYAASHDLQEPLRAVSSYVELLAGKYKGKLDEKADKYISFAVDGANRMSILINDLLTYSRAGTLGKQFAPVNMESMLRLAIANLKIAIEESKAVIDIKELPVVSGDGSQLVQLFQNLVGNALKFRKKDVPPRIRVSADRRKKEWVFAVHDNGIGIEPRFYERIFGIFQRLHTREEYAGTGVGLAICKRIVERHGGRIWVESKPGEGTSFYFTLPVREIHDDAN